MDYSNGKFLGVVAVAIAAIALFVSIGSGASAPTDPNAGGERGGLQEFFDGVKAGNIGSKWISKTLPVLANSSKLYCNTSGRDVIVDYGEVNYPTGQTASTTYQVSMFATSSASIPVTQNYTALAEGRRSLIQVSVATSSTATTTNSVYAAGANQGNGAVLVATNSCVFGYIQNLATGGGGPVCTGSVCETATSSNRGVNPVFNIRIHEGAESRPGTLSL